MRGALNCIRGDSGDNEDDAKARQTDMDCRLFFFVFSLFWFRVNDRLLIVEKA